MSDPREPEHFDDVDDAVGAEWESETTPYERVRAVVRHRYSPASARTIATAARTSPKTARKHLETMATEGFVSTSVGENGATTYRRSRESLVVEQAADVLDRFSVDELSQRVTDMREQIRELQAEHGVDTPEELAMSRTNETLSASETDAATDDSASTASETVQDWQRLRRNLAFANAALSIANAERYVDEDGSAADEGVAVR